MVAATVGFLTLPGMVHAAEIRVLSTQATEEAYRELVPQFEKAPGHRVTTIFTGTLDVIASGEAEIGFQQVSELSHFTGVDYVGSLPADVQHFTTFSSGIMAAARPG